MDASRPHSTIHNLGHFDARPVCCGDWQQGIHARGTGFFCHGKLEKWSVESTHKENLRDFERDNAFELGRREALLSLHAHVGEYVRSGAVKW